MEKLKDILKQKMRFISYNRSPERYFILEMEFIDFLFETPELAEIIRKIILKNKIPYNWLQDIFNSYIVCNYAYSSKKDSFLPLFWNEEIEERFNLKKSFLNLLEEEKVKSNRKQLKEEPKKEEIEDFNYTFTTYPYLDESYYNLKKLYQDIVPEIELFNTRNKKLTKTKGVTIDQKVVKKTEKQQVKQITFIKRNSQPKPSYNFYINNDLDDIRQLRRDSMRLRKIIEAIENNIDIDFNKDLLDYVNSNTDCALYCGGKYSLTKIFERNGNYLEIRYGINIKVISETEYRKKINKKIRA